MDFEPEKFFIGVIDLFSVLLPGALLTYLFKDYLGSLFLGGRYQSVGGAEGWLLFAFCSYLLGHFTFLLGAWLLDHYLYDPIRTATYVQQIERLADGKPLSTAMARWMAGRFFEKDADNAVRQAVRIKKHYLDPTKASSSMNAFQWCKARLMLEHPAALAAVQRFEADSKFFRSLVIVLLVLLVLLPWTPLQHRQAIAALGVILLWLAFWRYVDQRLKATSQAYWYLITLETQRDGGLPKPASSTDRPSRAGGVVFRRRGSRNEYLLVQAKRAPHVWVLPKGHVEEGERMQESAVREVREESGVWAAILQYLNDASFIVAGEAVDVRFYLMKAVEEGAPTDRGRAHVWLPLEKAVSRATHKETRDLLKQAEQARIVATEEEAP